VSHCLNRPKQAGLGTETYAREPIHRSRRWLADFFANAAQGSATPQVLGGSTEGGGGTYGHRRSLGPNSIDVQRSSTWALGSVTAFPLFTVPVHVIHEFNVAG
jgi:hypothetical protein